MDTDKLEAILQRNEAVRDTFLGVFALDRLPSRFELVDVQTQQERMGLSNRWFLVCNCCPSFKKGIHWIAVFYDEGSVEFFDSFALPPGVYDDDAARLTTFLDETSGAEEVIYSTTPLQSIDSDACGHYCVLFCVARSRGMPFKSIIGEVSTLTTRDDLMKFIVNTLL